jgi:hypothetical protein
MSSSRARNYFTFELATLVALGKEGTDWKHCGTGGQGYKENIWTSVKKVREAKENYRMRNFGNYWGVTNNKNKTGGYM